jgi:hypothetical protein
VAGLADDVRGLSAYIGLDEILKSSMQKEFFNEIAPKRTGARPTCGQRKRLHLQSALLAQL